MHESFESPGAIETWAIEKKHSLSYTKIFQKEKFPDKVNKIDFLIVMGGPQSPATTINECPYFDSKKEIEFIRRVIDSNKLVLGICLGAQLIGEALGAKFDHSPNKEIGIFDLILTDDVKYDPYFSKLPKKFPVGHWHGDMPGLTPESKLLAKSIGCPRQIVKYTSRVYGFQSHFEFTKASIEDMIINCSKELESAKGLPFVQTAEKLRTLDFRDMNNILFGFLDYFSGIKK